MALIRRILIELGFLVTRKLPDFTETYTKDYTTELGAFTVKLDIQDKSLVDLPNAYIIKVPEDLKGIAFPHIRNGEGEAYLCYIEKEMVNWNPIKPDSVLVNVDYWIRNTLQRISQKKDWLKEYSGEFINYWSGKSTYILAKSNNAKFIKYSKKIGLSQRECSEYAVFDLSKDLIKWQELRSGCQYSSQFPALFISLPNPYIPYGMSWPTITFKEFTDYLKKTNPNALNYLLQGILLKIKSHIKESVTDIINIAVIFDTGEGFLGFELCYLKKVKNIFKNFSTKRKIGSLLPLLTSKKSLNKFVPLKCLNTTENFIINRNSTTNTDLRGKKIALIGAGTIGGYTAQSIIQLGGGSGEIGSLDLYDPDEFKAHNLGRHYLGANYLGWLKTDALYCELIKHSPHDLTINSNPKAFTHKDFNRNKYDIIIDATGNNPFSLMLSKWRADLKSIEKRPQLIHGWIDGYGAVARVMIDDGHICYSCINQNIGNERFPVFKKGKKPQGLKHSRQCGSVYSAYESAVSMICAGLIQSAITRILKGDKWNFTQHAMNENVNRYSTQVVKRNKTCKCHG